MRAVMRLKAASAPTAMVAHHQAAAQQHSPWHSPVPYVFGGLAAMLGLIAFSLLLLACSYWKLSGYLEGENSGGDGSGDLESGEGKPVGAGACKPPEQRIVVIMAGDDKPTFLATPKSSRASSFGDNSNNGKDSDEDNSMGDEKKAETKAGGGDAQSHERQEEGTHENPEEMVTQQSQNQRQDLEDTHQSLDRGQ